MVVVEPALIKTSGRSDGPSLPEHPRPRYGSPQCSERAAASQAPHIPAPGVETFYGVREEHRRLHNIHIYIYIYRVRMHADFGFFVVFPYK